MRSRRQSLEASLAAAYAAAPGCPDPQTFLAASWNALADDEQRRIELHAERCPACAAERELARAFDEGSAADPADDENLSWVVARLERAGSVPPRFAPRRRVVVWRWASAAAVFAVAAAAFLAQRPAPPPLAPRPDAPAVLRGAALSIVSPAGDLAEPPQDLRFSPVAGAEGYRVRLLAVDDTILWDETVREARATLPPAVRDTLREAVSYRIQVEALDAAGARLAVSGPTTFRIVPGPGAESKGARQQQEEDAAR